MHFVTSCVLRSCRARACACPCYNKQELQDPKIKHAHCFLYYRAQNAIPCIQTAVSPVSLSCFRSFFLPFFLFFLQTATSVVFVPSSFFLFLEGSPLFIFLFISLILSTVYSPKSVPYFNLCFSHIHFSTSKRSTVAYAPPPLSLSFFIFSLHTCFSTRVEVVLGSNYTHDWSQKKKKTIAKRKDVAVANATKRR